ncbi:MAG TPA: type II toxin-antitoxin system VapC family toxin [Gaiellaceae bacterium]|nr:type II toxin-antitoxin system VapC family toxin [Gaiellaceae bacterium]
MSSARSANPAANVTTSWTQPIVVDTSALVELLLATPRSEAVRRATAASEIVAAELVDAEALSVIRRLERGRGIDAGRAADAIAELERAPFRRFQLQPLIAAAWALRQAVSTYDAFHVALAQALGCPLVTADHRLARAARRRVAVVLV